MLSGFYKYLALVVIGVTLGFWIAVKTINPSPSEQIEYIEEVTEAQEPMQEIVVEEAVRQAEIRIVEKVVEKEVIKYVDREIDPIACNIPIGSVRMLNNARSGELRTDSLQGTTDESDEEGRKASTVTRADLLESDTALAIEYNKVYTQLNALIEWIDIQQSSLDQ